MYLIVKCHVTRYVYGSEVASLRTSDDEIVSEGKCLSISDAIGRRLRDGDKIRYKVRHSRHDTELTLPLQLKLLRK